MSYNQVLLSVKAPFMLPCGTSTVCLCVCLMVPVHLRCSSGLTLIMWCCFLFLILSLTAFTRYFITIASSQICELCRQTEGKEWFSPANIQLLSPPKNLPSPYCIFGQCSIQYWWDRARNKPDNLNKQIAEFWFRKKAAGSWRRWKLQSIKGSGFSHKVASDVSFSSWVCSERTSWFSLCLLLHRNGKQLFC